MRASYGIFFDHPLLGLYFLGDASDASQSGQLFLGPGAPCGPNTGAPLNPANLNAVNTFQGTLTTPGCLPTVPGYIPGQQRFNAAPFSPSQASNPQFPGLFVSQNYLNPASFFPLVFQPFGYPQAKNFVYAYSQQVNISVERDLGGGFALNLAYNFNGGRHLNRPINANTTRGDLAMNNYLVALTDPTSGATVGGPLGVGTGSAPCGTNPGGQPWVSAALTNFFRPSAVNPALALAYLSNPLSAPCVTTVLPIILAEDGLANTCNYATLTGCVPFSDMDANFSNGSSVYHGFTANLRKRFNRHYEFLASYTWSHAIDDSTDLQAPLAPQDSYDPAAERSNSLFDQRHRFVFSGVYQTGKLGGNGSRGSFSAIGHSRPSSNSLPAGLSIFLREARTIFSFPPIPAAPTPTSTPPAPSRDIRCTTQSIRPPESSKNLAPQITTARSNLLDGNFPRNGGVHPGPFSTICASPSASISASVTTWN